MEHKEYNLDIVNIIDEYVQNLVKTHWGKWWVPSWILGIIKQWRYEQSINYDYY